MHSSIRRLLFAFIVVLCGCSVPRQRLPSTIAGYYPQGGGGIMSLGSEVYERRLLVRGPAHQFYNDTDKDFYLAYRGSDLAFLRFLASKDKDIDGELGEGWVSDTVVLALASDDSRLHAVLQRTNPMTRNYVCYIIQEYLKPADLRRYPQTMSLYDPTPFQKRNV